MERTQSNRNDSCLVNQSPSPVGVGTNQKCPNDPDEHWHHMANENVLLLELQPVADRWLNTSSGNLWCQSFDQSEELMWRGEDPDWGDTFKANRNDSFRFKGVLWPRPLLAAATAELHRGYVDRSWACATGAGEGQSEQTRQWSEQTNAVKQNF